MCPTRHSPQRANASSFDSEFGPNFISVAKSWTKVAPELRNQHFFATLDFADAVEVFRRVSCNFLHLGHLARLVAHNFL